MSKVTPFYVWQGPPSCPFKLKMGPAVPSSPATITSKHLQASFGKGEGAVITDIPGGLWPATLDPSVQFLLAGLRTFLLLPRFLLGPNLGTSTITYSFTRPQFCKKLEGISFEFLAALSRL